MGLGLGMGLALLPTDVFGVRALRGVGQHPGQRGLDGTGVASGGIAMATPSPLPSSSWGGLMGFVWLSFPVNPLRLHDWGAAVSGDTGWEGGGILSATSAALPGETEAQTLGAAERQEEHGESCVVRAGCGLQARPGLSAGSAVRAGLGALRLLPAPSQRTAPAPPSGCGPGSARQLLRPRLAGSAPGAPMSLCQRPRERRGRQRWGLGPAGRGGVGVALAAARSRRVPPAAAAVAVWVLVVFLCLCCAAGGASGGCGRQRPLPQRETRAELASRGGSGGGGWGQIGGDAACEPGSARCHPQLFILELQPAFCWRCHLRSCLCCCPSPSPVSVWESCTVPVLRSRGQPGVPAFFLPPQGAGRAGGEV